MISEEQERGTILKKLTAPLEGEFFKSKTDLNSSQPFRALC